VTATDAFGLLQINPISCCARFSDPGVEALCFFSSGLSR
jgi:hypothetical protein